MTIDEFNEWMEQLDKYAKVLRDYGRLLTAIEDIKTELSDWEYGLDMVNVSPEERDITKRILKEVIHTIDKHINREE